MGAFNVYCTAFEVIGQTLGKADGMASLTTDHATATMARVEAIVPGVRWRDHYPIICGLTLVAADCMAVAVATLLAAYVVWLAWHGVGVFAHPRGLATPLDLVALFAAIIVFLGLKGRYRERIPFWTDTRHVVCASLWAVGAEAVLALLAKDVFDARLPLIALLAFPVLATAINRLAKHILSRTGVWRLPILVVGDGPSAGAVEIALGSDRSLGYHFVGRIHPASLMSESAAPRLRAVLNRHRAERLLVVVDANGELQRQVIESALRERVPFTVVPPPHAFPAFGCDSTRVFSHDTLLLSFQDGLSRPMSRFIKAAIDISAALTLTILTVPLFLVLAVIIRLDGGPTFFAHRRVGAGGRPFLCLKFRTMVVDGDRVLRDALASDAAMAAEWAATRKLAHDPRVTRVGRFLRRTSLDELPQLINVLRLEMSLVGPRPIVEGEVPLYGEHIAQYYATRPGMTGLWQVSGRSNTSYARRVQLDVWYVNNWSVWHDIAVLLKTIPVVLGRQDAW
jgi:Undecaprenyl-phosphate galactose phosphotransferase WbaP